MSRKLLHFFFLASALSLAPAPASGIPTDFRPVIGGALLCRDHIDAARFTDYLTRHFSKPQKTEGDAYWFRVGAPLFGVQAEEVFVNVPTAGYVFLGAVLGEDVQNARTKIESATGIRFQELPGGAGYRAASGGRLIPYGGKSKLFCVQTRI